jgi:hypothetical protein
VPELKEPNEEIILVSYYKNWTKWEVEKYIIKNFVI